MRSLGSDFVLEAFAHGGARALAGAVLELLAIHADRRALIAFLKAERRTDFDLVLQLLGIDALEHFAEHLLRAFQEAVGARAHAHLDLIPFGPVADYASRIQARSPAVPTMLVQLCGGASGYLPSARAVQGGGYSADKFRVGPEGGQVLVEETLRQIQALFP